MGRLLYWLFGAYFVLGPFFFPNAPMVRSLPTGVSIVIGVAGFVLIREVVIFIEMMTSTFRVHWLLSITASWLTPAEIHERLKGRVQMESILGILYAGEHAGQTQSRPRSSLQNSAEPWREPNLVLGIEWKATFGGPRRRRNVFKISFGSAIGLPEGVRPA